ncbi:MAG: transporter substrate-binding domain-containing protein [Candidatus Liberibacter ctenarytainae]|uniref:Transporter substrate-binding domain-containing protein n=1 Tax=Candidatus Liberibacter ctenarytainae TaxID=2020335 RepID=A0A937ASM2_9HYPH|nr:transporter substrate-binding domain-containing protein [Candidatus Liberibacter ctenarytainae]
MCRFFRYLARIFFSKFMMVLAVLLFAIFLYVYTFYYTHDVSNPDEQSILRIGTDGIYPPHSFHDMNGKDQLIGFDIDLIKEVASRLNLKPVFFETRVSSLIAGIDIKRYDILVNVSITPERKKKYDFSIPYISHNVLLIVRSDENNIHSFKDIAGRKVSQILGTDLFRIAKELGAYVIFSDNFAQSMQLLSNKHADATMTADIPFFHFLQYRHDNDNQFKITDRREKSSDISFMMRKGSNKLKKSIDDTLCAIRSDGTYEKIFEKYFENNDISKMSICVS